MIQNRSHLLLHQVGLVQLGTGKECTNLWITALFELCFRLVEILNCNTCPPSSDKAKQHKTRVITGQHTVVYMIGAWSPRV